MEFIRTRLRKSGFSSMSVEPRKTIDDLPTRPVEATWSTTSMNDDDDVSDVRVTFQFLSFFCSRLT